MGEGLCGEVIVLQVKLSYMAVECLGCDWGNQVSGAHCVGPTQPTSVIAVCLCMHMVSLRETENRHAMFL